MMLRMLAVFEHATIVDRVTAGIERRAKEGRWPTGRLPFGYRRDEQKRVVPDERTAPIVKRIFDLYSRGGLGTAAIARTLAAEHRRGTRATTSSPGSPNSSPQRPPRRPTAPTSKPSPTSSNARSARQTQSRPKPSSVC
jgi:DNA invertase Pin-like site-specific DNA recombinase